MKKMVIVGALLTAVLMPNHEALARGGGGGHGGGGGFHGGASLAVSMRAPSALVFAAAPSAVEDFISSPAGFIVGVLASNALDVDLGRMDFMAAIPTIPAAIFMHTRTTGVPIEAHFS